MEEASNRGAVRDADVSPLALKAYEATAEWGDNACYGDGRPLGDADDTENRKASERQQVSFERKNERKKQFPKRQKLAEETKLSLLMAIRADLGVPDERQASPGDHGQVTPDRR